MVGTPRKCIRDPDLFPPGRHRAVRIKTKQFSLLPTCSTGGAIGVHVVTHRTHPERASWISPGVVQSNLWPAFKIEYWIVARIRLRLPQDDARAQNDSQDLRLIRKCDCRHWLVEKPRAYTPICGTETMNQEAVDVNPVHRVVRGMPDRTFAADVAGWSHTDGTGNHCTPMPASNPPSTR